MGQPDYHDTMAHGWNPPRAIQRDYSGARPSLTYTGPPELPAPPAWMRDAECREWVELFDQVYDYPSKPRIDACKAVCAGCPVIEQCLSFAMEQENDDTIYRYGVFGGLSAADRTRARTRRQGQRTQNIA